MITLRQGSLFDTELNAIGHGVNVDGYMGAGIAKQFKQRYPRNYEMYKHACNIHLLKPGAAICWFDNGKYIYNIASQDRPGPNAKLKWLRSGLQHAMILCIRSGVEELAIPRIAAGIGGLEWTEVLKVIEDLDKKYPKFNLEVWSLNGNK